MLFLQDAVVSCISHAPLAALQGCLPSLVEWPLIIQFTVSEDDPAIAPILTHYSSWGIFEITISLNMHVVNLKILEIQLE
jgi:hypothetical protein